MFYRKSFKKNAERLFNVMKQLRFQSMFYRKSFKKNLSGDDNESLIKVHVSIHVLSEVIQEDCSAARGN